MDPDRQTLDAFVDGELSPENMQRIAGLLEQRPDLDRYVREQEQLRAALKDAFAELAALPASSRLVRTVQTAPVSWRWRLRALVRRGVSPRSLLPLGAALAIGIAFGILLRPTPNFSINGAGQLIATGRMGHVLDTQLASMRYVGRGPRIGISFRDKAGHDCRTFSLGSSAGLACHQSGAWVIGVLVKRSPENPGAPYQMAGSTMPEAVRRIVEKSISGSPFDAAAERDARRHGWSGRGLGTLR
ncbi:MAG: hypothetical protein KGO02_21875 [Alphaproteobacteria bacterium]|nr:hypothetical protein [Alphaproteobacteria bacterium]